MPVLNIVSINFGMLDLIEYDVHIAAALIGHELAHIQTRTRKDKNITQIRGLAWKKRDL